MKKLFVLVPCMIVASMIHSADTKWASLQVTAEYVHPQKGFLSKDFKMGVNAKTKTVGDLVDKLNDEAHWDFAADEPSPQVYSLRIDDRELIGTPNDTLENVGIKPGYETNLLKAVFVVAGEAIKG